MWIPQTQEKLKLLSLSSSLPQVRGRNPALDSLPIVELGCDDLLSYIDITQLTFILALLVFCLIVILAPTP